MKLDSRYYLFIKVLLELASSILEFLLTSPCFRDLLLSFLCAFGAMKSGFLPFCLVAGILCYLRGLFPLSAYLIKKFYVLPARPTIQLNKKLRHTLVSENQEKA